MNKKHLTLAFHDVIQGLSLWRIWLLLGWQDIRLRYRRSILGPFWITLSMAIMIYSMGFLYGKLFKTELSTYFPYLSTGLVLWGFISIVIIESTDALFFNAHFIKQIKLPYTVYILRLLTRDFIIFLHNLLAIIPIFIFFKVPMSLTTFFVFISNLLILNLCGFCYGYMIAMLGTRFQDIKQIIVSMIQVFFLLTPIIWMPEMVPERFGFLAEYNPFYQLITLVRQPLLGQIPSLFTYGYSIFVMVIGYIMLFTLLWRSRHRIAFWI